MSLRDRLDSIMPGWDRWYPSVFDAAVDLGLLRARVCPPSQLLLSNRHAGVQQEAVQAFREKWYVEDDPLAPQGSEAAETPAQPTGGRGAPRDPEQNAARRLLEQALLADVPDLDLADAAPTPPTQPRKRRRNRRR